MFHSTVFWAFYFDQYRTIALGLCWAHYLLGTPCAPVSHDSPEKLPGAPQRSSLERSACAQYHAVALKNKKVKNRGLPLALLVGPALFRLGIFSSAILVRKTVVMERAFFWRATGRHPDDQQENTKNKLCCPWRSWPARPFFGWACFQCHPRTKNRIHGKIMFLEGSRKACGRPARNA